MKSTPLITVFSAAFFLVVPQVGYSALTKIYDASANWSDNSNPNGVWSYRDGSGAITGHVVDWLPGVTGPNAQPAWAATAANVPGHIVSWFKATNNAFDWQIGDVIVHTWDNSNGARTAPANLRWTAQEAGQIDILGGVWLARNIGRAVDWSVALDNAILTSGSLFDGDPYSRTSQFDILNGTGGAAALTGIHVNAGDTVNFVFNTKSSAGEFTGVNFRIAQTIAFAPEPSTLLLLGIPFAYLLRRGRSAIAGIAKDQAEN